MESASAKRVQINRSCEITDKDFTIDFPAGTHVVDKRNNQQLHKTSRGNGEFGPWIKRQSENRTRRSFMSGITSVVAVAGFVAFLIVAAKNWVWPRLRWSTLTVWGPRGR